MTTALDSRPTISAEVLADRLARARTWMAEADVAALIVYGAPGVLGSRTDSAGFVRWFTGWTSNSLPELIVVPLEGRPTVITLGPHDTRVFLQRAGAFGEVLAAGSLQRYPELAAAALPDGSIAALGFGEMPADALEALRARLGNRPIVDAGPAIAGLRLQRHPDEVAMHRRGAAISDAMIAAAMAHAVEPGMTGPRLMAEVEYAGRALGAGTPTTWLAVGEKPVTTYMEQAELHGPIGEHDRVQLGTSLTYEGHFAQSLRIGVRGPISANLRDYAQRLLDIQDAALAAMRPGAKLHEVSDAIESAIDRACPYTRDEDPFRFQSCHGLGLSYAEPGMARDLNARRDPTLDPSGVTIVENMVIEVHPNFTVPSLGHVCAGDMAVVTAHGGEWLTEFPRGLVQL